MAAPAAGAAVGGPSLEQATHTVSPRSAPWAVTVWEAAGEVVGTWNTGPRPETEASKLPPDDGGAVDPERAAKEASRRAATTVRRYVVSHNLTKFWTLTYDEDHLPDSLAAGWRDIEELRRQWPTEKWGPMVVVYEWGSTTGRFHWHALVGKWIDHRELRRMWGKGHVWLEDRCKVKRGEVGGKRAQARKAASYVAKYIAKSFEGGQDGNERTSGREKGGKRYSTSKGTKVEPRRLRFQSRDQAVGWALDDLIGGLSKITGLWESSDLEDWAGPPVWMLYWDDSGPP